MIPDFQTVMLPFQQHIAEGKEYTTTETLYFLAKQFNLTEEDLNQYLPSGTQKIFYNRVFWAKAHLKMSGLLENTKRRHFIITDRGKFERLVVDLPIKMGYGGSRKEAGRVIGKSGDGGIDGIINEDKLGLDTIYIQAKKGKAMRDSCFCPYKQE